MLPPSFLANYRDDIRSYIDGAPGQLGDSPVDAALSWLRGLERPAPSQWDLVGSLQGFTWLQVQQVAYRGDVAHLDATLTPWVALSRLDLRLAFLLIGDGGAAHLFWGVEGARSGPLTAVFDALWPGSVVVELPRPPTLPTGVIQRASGLPGSGAPGGAKDRIDDALSGTIDLLLRAASHCTHPWAWLVIAHPVELADLDGSARSTMGRITTLRATELVEHSLRARRRNTEALDELLEAHLALVTRALAEGGWLTYAAAISAADELQVLAAALGGVYGRPAGTGEPWTLMRPGQGHAVVPARAGEVTLLPSTAVALLADMPREEHPGIAVTRPRAFDLVPPLPDQPAGRRLTLGPVVEADRDLPFSLDLSLDDLTTHVFVAGITGSGKTTTVRTLIQQAAAQDVQVLIIEPVKREYRSLPLPGLRRYSLGEPGCDLQLNPFAFESGDLGVQVTTHIDHLKALFAAAYVLYPPMPYILEQALHEVYADRGWDFASGRCWRTSADDGLAKDPLAWPTLTELRDKVGEIVVRAGYGPRLEPEIRAALEVRIDNLRLGAKGSLLDVRPSATLDDLTRQPTVIELQGIGDAEQRAFLLGLLLTKLYEGCLSRGPSAALRLLVVIEEAHRLLGEPVGGGPDTANPQAKAIQTFGDMLAELRAYGVGLVIAEQSPSRITRQVLKNTGTKLAHQLIDEEEWRLMGGSMALEEDDARALALLPRGHALVFGHGMDRPLRVHIQPHDSSTTAGRIDRLAAQSAMLPARTELQQPGPTVDRTSALTTALAADVAVRQAFAAFVCAAWIGERAHISTTARRFEEVVGRHSPVSLESGERTIVAQRVHKELAAWAAGNWGRWYGWPFERERALTVNLAALLDVTDMGRAAFPPELANWFRAEPPFPGCRGCPSPCTYRAFVRLAGLDRLPLKIGTEEALYSAPGDAAERLVTADADSWYAVLRCVAAHFAHTLDWTDRDQLRFVGAVLDEREGT